MKQQRMSLLEKDSDRYREPKGDAISAACFLKPHFIYNPGINFAQLISSLSSVSEAFLPHSKMVESVSSWHSIVFLQSEAKGGENYERSERDDKSAS